MIGLINSGGRHALPCRVSGCLGKPFTDQGNGVRGSACQDMAEAARCRAGDGFGVRLLRGGCNRGAGAGGGFDEGLLVAGASSVGGAVQSMTAAAPARSVHRFRYGDLPPNWPGPRNRRFFAGRSRAGSRAGGQRGTRRLRRNPVHRDAGIDLGVRRVCPARVRQWKHVLIVNVHGGKGPALPAAADLRAGD